MEPKKLKKLVLKKDVISNLENDQMSQMRGGVSNPGLGCIGTGTAHWFTYPPCIWGDGGGGNGGGGGYGNINTQTSCENKESCVPRICPNPETNEVTICQTLVIGGCQTHYYC